MPDDDQVPSPQVNNISNTDPLTPLLLAAQEPQKVCHSDSMPDGKTCHNDFCECLHLLKIPLGDTVDIVLIDEGGLSYVYILNSYIYFTNKTYKPIYSFGKKILESIQISIIERSWM